MGVARWSERQRVLEGVHQGGTATVGGAGRCRGLPESQWERPEDAGGNASSGTMLVGVARGCGG